MRPLIPTCEYCNLGNPHVHTEDSLKAEIERLHDVLERERVRHRETVDRWVKTADEEREQKEAALLRGDEMKKLLADIHEAGHGLFLQLDPRAGVGERLSIVWDRLTPYAGKR